MPHLPTISNVISFLRNRQATKRRHRVGAGYSKRKGFLAVSAANKKIFQLFSGGVPQNSNMEIVENRKFRAPLGVMGRVYIFPTIIN